MKPVMLTIAVGLLFMLPSEGEARDPRRAYASARWVPPVVTVITPDLGPPISPYTYSRLDDGYDYPMGYGEYAKYGRWAFDRGGRPLVARCRLVWLDGVRWRSLNRCE